MKKLMILAAATTLIGWSAGAARGALETGAKAPDFTVTDSNGQEHSLSDFKGKYVVLEWINYGCPFVKKHYGAENMQALQEKYTGKDVVWLTICSSAPGKQGHFAPEKINAMNSDNGFAATAYLLDEDGTVGKAYGARTTPHMFVVNPDGTLGYQGAIDSIRSTNQDDIDDATNYVAEYLDLSMNGETPETTTTTPYGCSVKYAN